MKETDVLGQLKELPPIIINSDEIQEIPKHLRVNYVLTNYLKGGDTIAKTSLLKYFVNSVVGVVENINTNPVLRLYLGLLKSGMSIFELNTIFNNIVKPVQNNRNIPGRDEITNKVILDNFGKDGDILISSDLGREYDLLKEYIFEITEATCNDNNIEILLRDSISSEFVAKRVIVFKMDDEVAVIIEEKYQSYDEIVKESTLYMLCEGTNAADGSMRLIKLLTKLNTLVLQIFYDKINPKLNYVVIDNSGYHIQTKKEVKEEILNIDYDGLIKSMSYCLDNGMKRGYILVGCPGVGKSLTIHKIANHFKNVPTFIIKNERLTSANDVKRVFDMVRPFKAITVIDDFDGLEVEGKNYITNEFLYQMDINGGYCGIIIAAINDPSKVNYTLMNRPGRFDEVLLMKIPSSEDEVYYVLNNKLNNVGFGLEFICNCRQFDEFINKCIEHKFTHARIAGIVEYCICHFDEITLDNLISSMEALIEFTKNSQLMFDGDELINKKNVNVNGISAEEKASRVLTLTRGVKDTLESYDRANKRYYSEEDGTMEESPSETMTNTPSYRR